jgi:hypothetical protein
MFEPNPSSHGRRWFVLLIILIFALAGLWSGFWYYGVGVAESTLEGWKAREAKAGRVYTCAKQEISGFPFGIHIRCADAAADLTSTRPPLAFKTRDILVSASVLQPTVLNSEIIGPVTVADPGQPPHVAAKWRRAQTQVQGLPTSPQQVSIVIDEPVVDAVPDQSVFKATRVDVNGRMLSGTVRDNPVIEVRFKLAAAAAPYWHSAAATPTDADIVFVLRGLKVFAPKPWPVRFRELQAADGRIEIKGARVQQGETLAVAEGALGLSPSGRLDGQLRLTVANLDKILPALGIDRLLSEQAKPNRLNEAIGALDRIVPGLGNVARQNAGPAIVAGINLMGQPAELEGRRAVTLPLRFSNGAAFLGALPVGNVPPLF